MSPLVKSIFAIAPEVRYVATYLDGILESEQRPGIEGASSPESDKYEELIVNPTLLKLVTQRGEIDCGGAHWVVIRYGNFYELVIPVASGHLSVGLDLTIDPSAIVGRVLDAYKDELARTA